MSVKPSYENLSLGPDESFLYRRISREQRTNMMDGVWHYHPDFEITLTLKGSGKRFVGYSIHDFGESDLVLLGQNLPHCWITNQASDQVVINFKEDFLGTDFFSKPELSSIQSLLQKANFGLEITGEAKQRISELVLALADLEKLPRLQALLQILDEIANATGVVQLAESNYSMQNDLKNSKRIEQVYSYVLNNYAKELSLEAISDQLSMTKSSFCKFVKKITKKSFGKIVNEVRISQACHLLSTTDKNISEISYLSGYNNISNFNKRFKEIMDQTPLEYRKKYI